jgi:hypothetical protein
MHVCRTRREAGKRIVEQQVAGLGHDIQLLEDSSRITVRCGSSQPLRVVAMLAAGGLRAPDAIVAHGGEVAVVENAQQVALLLLPVPVWTICSPFFRAAAAFFFSRLAFRCYVMR